MSSSRTEIFVVEQSRPAERLDTYLRDRYPAVSRGAIQRLIEDGYVKVNDRPVKPTHHPHAGETISVHWPEPKASRLEPKDIPLEILYEDPDLLVLNKPPGLVVHPSAGHEERTLVHALLHHCQGQLSGIGGVQRPGIVHRLDKDTSGCLLVAKNDPTHLHLQNQFASRTLEKVYLAISCGELPRSGGDIRAAIARHADHRKRMAVYPDEEGGRQAWTTYRVLERLRGSTLVELTLHTGRTHQIRVHLQHLGYPLFGDALYGPRPTKRLAELVGFSPERIMLHAWKMAFVHPRSGRLLPCEAPVPEDFKQSLARLRTQDSLSRPPHAGGPKNFEKPS